MCRVYVDGFNTGDRGSFPIKNNEKPSYNFLTCFNKDGAVCFGKQVAKLSSTVRMFFWETQVLQFNDSFEIICCCSSNAGGMWHLREGTAVCSNNFFPLNNSPSIFYIITSVSFMRVQGVFSWPMERKKQR